MHQTYSEHMLTHSVSDVCLLTKLCENCFWVVQCFQVTAMEDVRVGDILPTLKYHS
jgi:hypothetical protein